VQPTSEHRKLAASSLILDMFTSTDRSQLLDKVRNEHGSGSTQEKGQLDINGKSPFCSNRSVVDDMILSTGSDSQGNRKNRSRPRCSRKNHVTHLLHSFCALKGENALEEGTELAADYPSHWQRPHEACTQLCLHCPMPIARPLRHSPVRT
jgi:hypothetical protein